jgi:hypothetical protein
MIDGAGDYSPMFKGIDSFHLGICKLDYVDEVLHVYLRRPGLLIGRKGETINLIMKALGCVIHIHEVDLLERGGE